jgi:hypothetical protein
MNLDYGYRLSQTPVDLGAYLTEGFLNVASSSDLGHKVA